MCRTLESEAQTLIPRTLARCIPLHPNRVRVTSLRVSTTSATTQTQAVFLDASQPHARRLVALHALNTAFLARPRLCAAIHAPPKLLPRPPPCGPHRPCRLQDCESLDECVRLGEAIPAAAVTQALGAARPRAEPPAPRLRGPVGGARLLPRPQASWRRGSRSAASLSTFCTSPPSGRVPQNPTRPAVANPEAPRACEAAPRGWRKPAPRATAAGGVQSRDGGGGHCDAAGVGPNPANQTLLSPSSPRTTRQGDALDFKLTNAERGD